MVVSERGEMDSNYWKCINPTKGYCYCSYYHYYYYYYFRDSCYYIFRGIPEEAVKRKLPKIEQSEGGDGKLLHTFTEIGQQTNKAMDSQRTLDDDKKPKDRKH